jgi:hypothetical protein
LSGSVNADPMATTNVVSPVIKNNLHENV